MKTAPGVTYIDDYQPNRGTIRAHADGNPDGLAEGGSLGKTGRLMALFSAEVGGSNCMAPLYVGGRMDLPVVDCDLMGRAFPELQVGSFCSQLMINGCRATRECIPISTLM